VQTDRIDVGVAVAEAELARERRQGHAVRRDDGEEFKM
jgi:hypothetical protein